MALARVVCLGSHRTDTKTFFFDETMMQSKHLGKGKRSDLKHNDFFSSFKKQHMHIQVFT